MLYKILIIYLIIINILAVIFTVFDIIRAIDNKWRVKESTLILLSVLGGSVLMYLTMLLIRHKTRKPLFMVGIPIIFILQLVAVYVLMGLI